MGDPVTINIRHLARGLGIPLGQVQATLELLDEGNTVPFITRYRKDQTGGLDEEQVRQIQSRLEKMRLLTDRKQTILRSIELQGKLTAELDKRIRSANTAKRLEDLYLPYKPKKQTLAQLARSRGLEVLADEIIGRSPGCLDLDQRAADFVNPDRGVPTAAEALLGAGHILAERISENVELRQRLREVLQKSGKIVSAQMGVEEKPAAARPAAPPPSAPTPKATKPTPQATEPAPQATEPAPQATEPAPQATEPAPQATEPAPQAADGAPQAAEPTPEVAEPTPQATEPTPQATEPTPQAAEPVLEAIEPAPEAPEPPGTDNAGEQPAEEASGPPPGDGPAGETPAARDADQLGSGMGGGPQPPLEGDSSQPEPETEVPSSSDRGEPVESAGPESPASPEAASMPIESGSPGPADSQPVPPPESPAPEQPPSTAAGAGQPGDPAGNGGQSPPPAALPAKPPPTSSRPKRSRSKRGGLERRADRKREKKRRAEEKKQKAFSDYFNYGEELRKIPPHRVLAINRGERAKYLRVKVDCDQQAMLQAVDQLCVPEDHPHLDFLRGCARDALARLVVPSLEREVRRELTDRAEQHAVGVFAKNLRNLLLQPPVHDRRVLAVDPGFKSGCKLVALDQFGNVLAHAVIFLIGKPERKEEAQATVKELMQRFKLSVVAIGNGTACRDAEDFFGELLGETQEAGWVYSIVNEAGASVYSTSSIGREEFPDYDASLRGAISIGRRLQDPLSELVKIDPANIGVGLYQHDVKAKHLRLSLDEVVRSCVNFVGVDINTASPSLLSYVSGLNQLTARRVYEHRLQNGPFRNREQLKNVPGFGEATFVQAAGFLKISSGDNALDATWIHPESYPVATRVLACLGYHVEDLRNRESLKGLAEKASQVDAKALAEELGVGMLLLKDILSQLARPGRDPREDLPPPIFRRGVLKLEDLAPGMELNGTVLNVVDFGVFVDIGMHDSGLVHVSQLADRFVRDPHEVAAVGNVVKVWVLEVDKERRRVSLTMIPPGAHRGAAHRDAKPERREPSKRPEAPRGERKPRERGGRHGGGERREWRDRQRSHGQGRGGPPPHRPKPPPRPIKPITEDMKKGREPMRSFSDLAQFFDVRREEVEPPPEKKKKKRKRKPGQQSDGQAATAPKDADPPAASGNADPPPLPEPTEAPDVGPPPNADTDAGAQSPPAEQPGQDQAKPENPPAGEP
ncbi:MAG: Tex-like N-terminal domain-containing protein [Thermoguttaceae bacterium]|nr:Tex-like N-terminal domain-containing protein [Thermoguttaceae bacterium]